MRPHDHACDNWRPGPYTPDQCRLCWLCHNNREYGEAWGCVPVATETPRAGAPSPIEKVRNFRAAYRKWDAAGKPLTPAAELAQRRAACDACPHRDPSTDSCLKCGCPLVEVGLLVSLVSDAPGKLLMATESCPLPEPEKRWRALV